MAGKGGFGVTIGAIDLATPILDRVNKRIAAMTAPAERFNRAMAKFGRVTGISRLTQEMTGLGHASLDTFRSVERIVSPMSAITGAGSIAGMAMLTRRWADLGNEVQQTSFRLNMGAGRLTNLEAAAQLAGVSAGTLDNGLRGLGKTLSDATYGRDPQAVRVFHQLGIAFKDANDHALQAVDTLPKVADALKRYPDARTKEHLLDIFHIDPALLPFLKNGSAGMANLLLQSRGLGGGMTDQMADHAMKAEVAYQKLKLSIEGVSNRLVDQYSGPMTKWMDTASNWIGKNKETADSIGKVGVALSGLMALKPAGWLLAKVGFRGFGAALSVAGSAPAAIGEVIAGEELLYRGTRVSPTQSQEQENALLGGRFSSRYPGLVVPRTVPLGPSGAGYLPRGIRNNNPLNLSYVPGQGAIGSDGRFGIYRNMESGIAAADAQLQQYQDTYRLNTIRGIVSRWAPPGENDTDAYVQAVSSEMHVGPDQPINVHDQATAAQLISAMARRETGRTIDPSVIRRGVAMGDPGSMMSGMPGTEARRGTGAAPSAFSGQDVTDFSRGAYPRSLYDIGQGSALAPQPGGHVQVDVHLRGAPPGTTATVTTQGRVSASPPRIETSMPTAR